MKVLFQKTLEILNPELYPDAAREENILSCRLLLVVGLISFVLGMLMEVLCFHRVEHLSLLLGLGAFGMFSGLYLQHQTYVERNATVVLEIMIFGLLVSISYVDCSFYFATPALVSSFLLSILPVLILDKPWRILVLILMNALLIVFFCFRSSEPEVFYRTLCCLAPLTFIACFLCAYVSFNRIRAMKKNLSIREVAEHDPLTGIFNRWGGIMLIRSMVRDHMSGSFLIVDVDDFKHVNDAYGHQKGDEILKEVALTLKRSFKASDIVMRMGGDEFIVYAAGMVDYRVTEERLTRFLNRIHEIYLDEERTEHLTVSVGCVINDGTYPDYDVLFSTADLFLYKTKEKGKDNFSILDVTYTDKERRS